MWQNIVPQILNFVFSEPWGPVVSCGLYRRQAARGPESVCAVFTRSLADIPFAVRLFSSLVGNFRDTDQSDCLMGSEDSPALSTIVHLDADAFFVSVEQAEHPELRGKKVAVGGRQRGIISSASYEARACGVYTPMPTTRALKVCPDLLVVGHTSGLYSDYSRRLFDLCEQVTPWVERNSIDEGYLDVAPCRYKSGDEIEQAIRGLQQRIIKELGITVSFGIARNKLVAAIASKLRKPRGFVVIAPGDEERFLAPLSIGK